MRIIKGLIFGIMFFGILVFLFSQSFVRIAPDCEKAYCGKVVGTIIDAETGKEVKGDFWISFCECEKKDPVSIVWSGGSGYFKYGIIIENGGKFSVNVPEGRYCLWFSPILNSSSKYAADPYPGFIPGENQEIIVSRAKVTTIRKFIKPGGTLKLTLVDAAGNKINPMEIFTQRFHISANLFSDSAFFIPAQAELSDRSELDDGEMIVYSLPPGAYNMNVEFDTMGYGNQEFENIIIERKKMTEVKVLVDLNSTTGVEGKITDQFNNPLKDFYVTVTCTDCVKQLFFSWSACNKTDIYGNYKIIGLKEKLYSIDIEGDFNGVSIKKTIENIPIKNNSILKKDIVIDFSK
jgi:hypothetical protein